ncbi:MAG: hypothetical protein OHK93_004930 [Ramalina farinacea]|uniref:Uncharacterized protein n=1 Tax=Ramalina farinacea TaxID=258253 RepID=A0AA43TYX5_9LECA|nr:hypothetical protein [Ramalina farinacea]
MPRSNPFCNLHETVRIIDKRLHDLEASSERRFGYSYDRLNDVDQALQAQIQDSHQHLESQIADIHAAQNNPTANDTPSSLSISYRIPTPAADTNTELLRRSQNGVHDLDPYAEHDYHLSDWEHRAGGDLAIPSKQVRRPTPSITSTPSTRHSPSRTSTRRISQVDGVKKCRSSANTGRHDTKPSALTRARVGLSYIEDAIDQGLTDKEVDLIFDEIEKLGQRAGWN